jgi:shikimate kinase
MNIVLIGYRGTGKTAVGTRLAQMLGWPLMQLDEMIMQQEGRSISEIVAGSGWDYFRDLESRAVLAAAGHDACIIDTGGGVVLRSENVEQLKRTGLLFWLTADPATIRDRIKDDTQRPALTEGTSFTEEVETVLKQRLPLYMKARDVTIDTAGRTVDSLAEEIVRIYNRRAQGVAGRRNKR